VPAPLLATKLYIPPPRPNLVRRAHLIGQLEEGRRLGYRLILLSAPAGFGKTTLLSDWIQRRRGGVTPPLHVAWLSLDEGDSDPVRFLAYLIGALQTIEASIGEGLLDALQSPQRPAMETALTVVVNEMSALPRGSVLVLDDYHAIKAQPVHHMLLFLLEHMPLQMHLVIASRADPPLPIARLRGRGQLTELRAADLRFTPDEAATFLNEIMGLDLSADDVMALEERTEGWITGLQLAAISMQGREDIPAFLRAFTGSSRFILDYLTEEVLQRQPEGVQSFLLKTAILERLTGPLCDAVTRREDGAAMLKALERANLFLIPLDDERRWYRYHRLFADLLRARLGEAWPDRVPELHRRASDWYEQNGDLDDAVTHALAAGDMARVSKKIEAYGMPMLMRGELMTLGRWISALPEEMIRASARISVLHAWALLLTGQTRAVEPRLQQTERVLATMPAGDLRGNIAAIRAYVAAQQGDVARTIELANLALELLPAENLGERGVVFFVLGAAYLLRGDLAGAGEAMAEASLVGQQGGNIHLAVPALNALAGIQAQQGRLHKALATAQAAVQLAIGPAGHPLPIAGGAISALAELAHEWNDLESALDYARQSIDLSQRWGNSDTLCHGYLTLAQVLQAQGDLEGARDALQKAEQMSGDLTPTPLFLAQLRAAWAELRLMEGDLAAAVRWAEDLDLQHPDLVHAAEALALARVRLALGQPGAALKVLAPVLELARAQDMTAVVIAALVLQSRAYHAQGGVDRALAALAEALSLAEPQGFTRTFVSEGGAMASLLRLAAGRGIAVPYVSKLLSAFGMLASETEDTLPSPRVQPLIEPLSSRELEVLTLVGQGLSNRDIARQLYIAESTVKSHLNAVYRKLDVKNRTQAVTQARALNLFD